MSNLQRCFFCGGYFTPPEYPRTPSSACQTCWLEIWAGIAAALDKEKEKNNGERG